MNILFKGLISGVPVNKILLIQGPTYRDYTVTIFQKQIDGPVKNNNIFCRNSNFDYMMSPNMFHLPIIPHPLIPSPYVPLPPNFFSFLRPLNDFFNIQSPPPHTQQSRHQSYLPHPCPCDSLP